MSGINSLSGLGKVSVDYRPKIGPDAPNAENGPQPQQGEGIDNDSNLLPRRV